MPAMSAAPQSPAMSPMRRLDAVDDWFGRIQTRLAEVSAAPDARPATATATAQGLSPRERRLSAGLMRVNHAGEVAAQGLYQGQARMARSAPIRAHMLEAAAEERAHLEWCRGRLDALGSAPSLLDPLWYMGSYALGAAVARLGVVGIIYESRPNVTADAAALCLKSGNASVLRGGREALQSNQAIAACIGEALSAAGLPEAAVQVLDFTEREAVRLMVTLPEYIDVVVPRGGKGLVAAVSEGARVPVIKHLDGICHVYLHDAAPAQMAVDIAVNAKTQRFGTCNTMETLLIARSRLEELLPPVAQGMRAKGVELRGCAACREVDAQMQPASEEDWATEYLAPILSVRAVDDFEAALAHIRQYSSGHTEAIVTADHATAMRFLREVDSSSVMVNASTRFADGFEYGLGAEIGISTDKFHARGPVGLEGLTSEKYIVFGEGQIRE